MKIKTRLIIYNVIVAIITSFIIIGVIFIGAIKVLTRYSNIDNIKIDQNISLVKDIIDTCDDYEQCKENISVYDYILMVYDEDANIIYGDNKNDVMLVIKNSEISNNTTEEIYVSNETAVIRRNNNVIYVALKNGKVTTDNGLTKILLKFSNNIIFAFIIILILISIFSKFIISRIMEPINKLSNATKRIANGNLEEEIEYERNDEFKSLIENFNIMSKHLNEETTKNKKYEIAKKEMINGISHDIRTPLTAVKGSLKALKKNEFDSEEKRDKYINIAVNRTDDIEKLLNTLFETFNYETGEIVLDLNKVNIEEYIHNYIKDKEELHDKNIKFKYNHLSSTEYLMIDKNQFKRIFDNLINNSIKYANVEKIVIDINIWKENGNLKISYKDNGKGVKEENLEKIFDEFFKEDLSRNNTNKKGSGLGLFIVKSIVMAHNGTIEASNKKGLYFEMSFGGEISEDINS